MFKNSLDGTRSANLDLASYQKIGKKSESMRGVVFIKKMILKEKLYNIRLKHIYTDHDIWSIVA